VDAVSAGDDILREIFAAPKRLRPTSAGPWTIEDHGNAVDVVASNGDRLVGVHRELAAWLVARGPRAELPPR
jgi:hypothetical protein